MSKRATRAALLFAAFGLCACAGSVSRQRIEFDPGGPQLVSAPFGDLIEQWVSAPGNLYMKRPRPDFTSYRAMRIEQPGLFYDARVTPPILQDHGKLVRALEASVAQEVSESIPLPITTERGAGILRVRSEVTGLEFDRARATNSRVTSIVQPGAAAIFVLDLSDDASGTPLLRVAARRQLPGGIYTGPWAPDIDRALELFRGFAQDARDCLALVFKSSVAQE